VDIKMFPPSLIRGIIAIIPRLLYFIAATFIVNISSTALPRKSPEGCSAGRLNAAHIIEEGFPGPPSGISHYTIPGKLNEAGMSVV
jgi:hypothetical protein